MRSWPKRFPGPSACWAQPLSFLHHWDLIGAFWPGPEPPGVCASSAALGPARHPFLPLWADLDVPAGVSAAVVAHVRRLHGRSLSWFTLAFVGDVLQHAILPALSIILVATGGWALTMRGMMVTTQGEDYVTFAEAKGLKSRTVFLRYCVRNAICPRPRPWHWPWDRSSLARSWLR